MSFLTSKVIWTPFRNQECPPRFLGGCSGDTKENILFQCTKGPEILHRASLMFVHVILDVHSHLYSILESRISSKTPWRMLWRLKWEWRMSSSSAPIGLKFCTELPWYLYLSYNPLSKKCRICLKEKYFIMHRRDGSTLNKRSEVYNTCRHRRGKLLVNVKTWDYPSFFLKIFSIRYGNLYVYT